MCPATIEKNHIRPCLFECQSDSDCLGSNKCCKAGCAKQCMAPVGIVNVEKREAEFTKQSAMPASQVESTTGDEKLKTVSKVSGL